MPQTALRAPRPAVDGPASTHASHNGAAERIDKFFNEMVHWPKYLAPWINDIVPGTAQQAMYFVGGIEIVAGLLVLIKPRYGAYVVAAWLAGIIINLLSYSGYYDVALRDFGLMLAALTLARLASVYDPPLSFRRR
jgi:uncharacterized membrane protein YphA (DoxX/SURF4 family)